MSNEQSSITKLHLKYLHEALDSASTSIHSLSDEWGNELNSQTLQDVLQALLEDDPNFTDDFAGHIWEMYQTISAWIIYYSLNVPEDDLYDGVYVRKFRLLRAALYWLSVAHRHSFEI